MNKEEKNKIIDKAVDRMAEIIILQIEEQEKKKREIKQKRIKIY